MDCNSCGDGENKNPILEKTEDFDDQGTILLFCPSCFVVDNANLRDKRHITIKIINKQKVYSNHFRKNTLHSFSHLCNVKDREQRLIKVKEVTKYSKNIDDSSFLKMVADIFSQSSIKVHTFFHYEYMRVLYNDRKH